jgi:hypothetical protein
MILRQRGQNRNLAQEILEKISPEGRERLFRIFQDIEHDQMRLEKKAKMPWIP